MPDPVVESLILDLLEWLARTDRTYAETMEAWRTSCPKLPIWEETIDRGLATLQIEDGRRAVRLTPAGLSLLQQSRATKERASVQP